jgi:hypothetical protein
MYGNNDEKSSTASNLLVLGTRLDRKTRDMIAFMLIMTIPAGFARYDLFDVSSFFSYRLCTSYQSLGINAELASRTAGSRVTRISIYIYHLLFPPEQENFLFPL